MGERSVIDTDFINDAVEEFFCDATIVSRAKIDSFPKGDKGV